MRILHFMPRFRLEDGGVVRAVLDMCAILAKHGVDVEIATWDATDVPEEWKRGEPNCPTMVMLPPPSLPAGFFAAAAMEQVQSRLADNVVVHLHMPWERPYLQIARAARRAGRPYVLSVHGMLDDWCMAQKGLKKRVYLALGARRMLERATFVHCTAQGELDQARRWFPRGRGRVVPLILDLEPYRNPPGPQLARREIAAAGTDDPIVLFLSRVHYKKRPEVLIDAAAMLRDQGRPFRVLIAGTGDEAYMEQLRARVSRHRLEDRVFFLGLVVGDVKISLFEHATVFVLPTSQENFGFVLAEALASGTPVITTRGTDIWPELERCGGALIVEGEPEATAQAIARLLDDPKTVAEMGSAGREWVMRSLDPDVIAEAFIAMYRDCLDTRS